MENEIYSVLKNTDDYRNFNKQLHRCLNSTRGWYANTLEFQINDDGCLYCDVTFDKLLNYDDYCPFSLKKIAVHIDFDDIDDTNRIIRNIINDIGFIKAIHIRFAYADIIYLPFNEQSVDDEVLEEEVKEETPNMRYTRAMRHTRSDNESLVVNLPRFNQNAFEFGEAYFIRMKSVNKAIELLKYRRHCDDKINEWIPEYLNDIAESLEYGVYALFKDITHQGTLITFFVAYRSIDTDTTKKCVGLSIPIDAIDDIEITKLDIDTFTRKEKKNED